MGTMWGLCLKINDLLRTPTYVWVYGWLGGWVIGWMGGFICESMGGVRSYNRSSNRS